MLTTIWWPPHKDQDEHGTLPFGSWSAHTHWVKIVARSRIDDRIQTKQNYFNSLWEYRMDAAPLLCVPKKTEYTCSKTDIKSTYILQGIYGRTRKPFWVNIRSMAPNRRILISKVMSIMDKITDKYNHDRWDGNNLLRTPHNISTTWLYR